MKLSAELIIALWGAIIATILGVIQIVKEFHQRPKIQTDASIISCSCSEDEDTHRVKVRTKRGDDNLLEEVCVEFTIRNSGSLPIQISAAYVETETHITQVIPSVLPVVLQQNTAISFVVQPEIISPMKIDVDATQPDTLTQEKVISIGVLDALGKKHHISSERLDTLVKACGELPLRVGVYEHRETGNKVSAYQMKDKAVLIKK